MIVFSLLCRAFNCLLISYIFYQEESDDDDDDAAVREQANKGMNVGKNEIGPGR
jgi:hypothetical protein